MDLAPSRGRSTLGSEKVYLSRRKGLPQLWSSLAFAYTLTACSEQRDPVGEIFVHLLGGLEV